MKLGRCRRYNKKKRGSYEVAVWLTDWELAVLIKALKLRLEKYPDDKAIQTWTKKRIKILGKALSKVLKYEMTDLKGQTRITDFKELMMESEEFKKLNNWDRLRRCVEYYMNRHPRDRDECKQLLKFIDKLQTLL